MSIYSGIAATVVALIFYRLLQSKPIEYDQTVVIIGASDGIGREIAKLYAERRSKLLLVSRSLSKLTEVQKECLALGCISADVLPLDVTVESNCKLVRDKLTSCDVLVLCVGVLGIRVFGDLSPNEACEVAEKMVKTNVLSPVYMTSYLLDLLKQSKGRIVVVSSTAGELPAPSRALYASSKFALSGFFKSLRIETQSSGVSVTIALPGTVATSFRENALDLAYGTSSSSMTTKIEPSKVTPKSAAKLIVGAADSRSREVVFPYFYKLVMLLSAVAPWLTDLLAKLKYGVK
ncbi:hypothetical protein SmJEL517_g02659 [Synchytrium microbalum]|uniref:Ketoreductase domain-containing protein n=1 Tax=Synchytrium microbalum TaxID=1806994 RepID=A0A507C6A3_9FUNG|nr:uncharacterized protein SmJEL517_g02659 [Synchytrium microbalum]TPX34878.1 hypothetical protein SmJEL517_g02659 [Synchytrium microbalum]